MRERTVGSSGLKIGQIGLGTLTWGRDTDEDEARGQLRALLDAGGSFIDTSPAFGTNASESCLGAVLNGFCRRDQVVISTRAGYTLGTNGLRYGSGRGTLFDSVMGSLERIGTPYLDLLLVDGPDLLTPEEETVEALGWLISRGLVRYIGVQGYSAWHAAILQEKLRAGGLPLMCALEKEYSLLCRNDEESTTAMAQHCGMGILASSPLGRGVLTGKYRHSIPPTSRAASEHLAGFVDPYLGDKPRRIVEAVAQAADGLGRTLADVALAWVLSRPSISAAIVGARTAQQMQQTLNHVGLLPELVTDVLDEVSL